MVNCFKRTSILILLALFSFLNAQEFWIKTRPVAPKYYIGIASGKTKEEAKTKALNDLASEISVSINSELVDIMTEYSGFSEDYTRSQITVSVAQDLEGYERVGEDKVDDQYWVYYRLSKSYFKRYADDAINAYQNYRSSQGDGDVIAELTFLVSSLEYIYRAVGQDITDPDTKKNLRAEVPRLIKSLLSDIDITTTKQSYDAYYGRAIDEVINARVTKDSNPVSAIDMELRFQRGDGEFLANQIQTERDGRFQASVTQINSKDEQQVITLSINLVKFKTDVNKTNFLDNTLKAMARNNGRKIMINVSEYRKDKVAVLVVGDGLNQILLSSLMSKFNNEYKNQTDFDIMDPREAESVLEREGFNIEPCTSYECQVEIGGKLGVDNLVFIKISYLAGSRLLNISTVFSEIYSKRVGETDDIDINVKRGQTPDEVIIRNVPNIVSSFWSKFNPGTLIINSSIPSISVEIIKQGGQIPDNRTTPFEMELSPGAYTLNFNKIGYVPRAERVVINKSDKQMFTIELKKKTRLKAFTRSLLIPGYGQMYSVDAQHPGRKRAARLFRWSLVAGVAMSGYSWSMHNQSITDYKSAKEDYMAASTLSEISSTRDIAQQKNQTMLTNQTIFQGTLALIGVLWVGNAVEAMANFPDYGFIISLENQLPNGSQFVSDPHPTLSLSYRF